MISLAFEKPRDWYVVIAHVVDFLEIFALG